MSITASEARKKIDSMRPAQITNDVNAYMRQIDDYIEACVKECLDYVDFTLDKSAVDSIVCKELSQHYKRLGYKTSFTENKVGRLVLTIKW
jgi:hypothetical protein